MKGWTCHQTPIVTRSTPVAPRRIALLPSPCQDVEPLSRPIENKPSIGGAAARASLKDAVAELSFKPVDPSANEGTRRTGLSPLC
ncbi:MAG: hypothetical protein ACLT98_13990 [Eggerthellaceae bacterium]